MPDSKPVRSAEIEDELRLLRAELAETEGGVADEGKSSECVDVDDRVAGIRQRIRDITGK